MPFHYVQRYAPSVTITGVGTQVVNGDLDITGLTIEYDPSLFNTTDYPAGSTFVIFTYTGTLTGSVGSITSVLTGTGYSSATYVNDTSVSPAQIRVTLN